MFFTRIRIWSMLAVVAVAAMALALFAPAASADEHTFDLSVYHGINGQAIGLSKDLPVDVYVNGELAIPDLEFKDKIEGIELPAGDYYIQVALAGTNTFIDSMSVGSPSNPAAIPGGVDVSVHAKLSGGKTPILKVKIK